MPYTVFRCDWLNLTVDRIAKSGLGCFISNVKSDGIRKEGNFDGFKMKLEEKSIGVPNVH